MLLILKTFLNKKNIYFLFYFIINKVNKIYIYFNINKVYK